MTKRNLTALLLLNLLFVSAAVYSQAEIVARVTLLTGEAEVIRANGVREPLQRRKEIMEGDDIETASDAAVQLMFADGALVALRCNSKLSVYAFSYGNADDYNAELILHWGSLRAVIGEIAPGKYHLSIAETVVHGNDSDFEVTLAEDGTQYFGVYDGVMTIEHAQLESNLGRGANADFARLDIGFPFEELSQMPPQLGHSVLFFPTNPNTFRSTNCAN